MSTSREEFDKWLAAQPSCIGYPDCNGDLEGMNHSSKCPIKERGRIVNYTLLDVWEAGRQSGEGR